MVTPTIQDRRSLPASAHLHLAPSTSSQSLAALSYPLPSSGLLSPGDRRQPSSPGGLPSPGSSRARTPLNVGPTESELAIFRQSCSTFYYNSDEAAGREITSILKNAPSSYRAIYSVQQSEIRAQYHKDNENSRRIQLDETIKNCTPGSGLRDIVGVLALAAVDQWRSRPAALSRQHALLSFLRSHALKSHPGPHPFLRSLYAVLWLQSQSTSQGGAGANLVEWDIDDACFLESGPEFLVDAVQLLIAHLGFDDTVKSDTSLSRSTSVASTITASGQVKPPPMREAVGANPLLSNRDSSPSDPFLDPSARSNGASPAGFDSRQPLLRQSSTSLPLRWRTFTVARYITNTEAKALSRLFPSWIKFPKPTSFPHPASGDTERATAEIDMSQGQLKSGHGIVRRGSKPRDEDFKGSLWQRFVDWLLRR